MNADEARELTKKAFEEHLLIKEERITYIISKINEMIKEKASNGESFYRTTISESDEILKRVVKFFKEQRYEVKYSVSVVATIIEIRW